MNSILELVHVDDSKVVVKFKELSNLEKAMNSWVLPEAEYVTITRGRDHIMRIIRKDGSSWSIEWGDSGCTAMSKSLIESRNRIVDFIEQECHILLNITKIVGATVLYSRNLCSWQINFKDCRGTIETVWNKDCNNEYDIIELANKIIGKDCTWKKGIAQTGINVWEANI